MQSLSFRAQSFTEGIQFAASQHRGHFAASVAASFPGVTPIRILSNVGYEKTARSIRGSIVIRFAPFLEFGLGCIENVLHTGIYVAMQR
jgi:hypothetical protein